MRGVPDVSGHADPNNGIKVRVDGSDSVSGGTSAVAPQWAALTAVLSQALKRKARFFIPLLYGNLSTATTNDVVSGNNSVYGVTGFSAKQGWDACTGLGSPNGEKLLALLSGTPVLRASGEPTARRRRSRRRDGSTAPRERGLRSAGGRPLRPVRTGGLFHVRRRVRRTHTRAVGFRPPVTTWPRGVQMQDFIIGSTGPSFYGFIAQSTSNANRFVLALRGTSDGVEWWRRCDRRIQDAVRDPKLRSRRERLCANLRYARSRRAHTRQRGSHGASLACAVGSFSEQIADLIGRRAPRWRCARWVAGRDLG